VTETVDVADLPRPTREHLADLPPTATVVYLHLHNEGGARTLRQIAYETARPRKSIHRALRTLHDEGLVSCSPRHTEPPASEWKIAGMSE
jgi:predicted transcriptional regulator